MWTISSVHENLSQRLVDFKGLREAFAQLLLVPG